MKTKWRLVRSKLRFPILFCEGMLCLSSYERQFGARSDLITRIQNQLKI